MIVSDYIPITYKRELSKILKLSSKHINYLIDNNIIIIKKMGSKYLVSITSLKRFQSLFNRDDYVTKREVIKTLTDDGYYGVYIPQLKMYDKSYIGFPQTYQHFVKNGYLKVYTIDKTDFVSIESFYSLRSELKQLHTKLFKITNIKRIDKKG